MYDRDWAQEKVANWAILCARAQHLKSEFELYQASYEVKKPVDFEEALVYTLAASQGDSTAARAWNKVKRLGKPCGAEKESDVDNLWKTIYRYGLAKGRRWRQTSLFC